MTICLIRLSFNVVKKQNPSLTYKIGRGDGHINVIII